MKPSSRRLVCAAALAWEVAVGNAWGEAVSFRNDVMAVLSKSGCNAGACHGNANGKAGFKLSLRGESPALDFAALTHDQFARRVNLAEPAESLILLKPTTTLAHEGGLRFKTNSWEYQSLLRWISEGAADDVKSAPALQRLEVSPLDVVILAPTNQAQIRARAFFSNGTARDVSTIAVYESANPAVKVSAAGLAQAEVPGETTVLVRYLDQQVPVRLAFVPERPGYAWSGARPNNYIDYEIFAKLQRLRMNPSELCSDEQFVRRAYLDLLGVVPAAAEARAFVLDRTATKRARLIDELLERPEFADFWALKWCDLLRAEERVLDRKGLELFHRWVRQGIIEHKPLDRFAREVLAAQGSTYKNPAGNFYRAARTVTERAEGAAQLFLGVRMQCAQCHNHPFDRWTQNDYYDWQRVFARVSYKVLENRRRDDNDGHEFKGEQIIYRAATAEVKYPRSGMPAHARFLGEKADCDAGGDELAALAGWLTRPENPFFARAQVNRIWYHLFGRGMVEPLDDFRASNPPSHPELLEGLARDFVEHGYDLRQTIRVIMNSRTYQLSSVPNETNGADEANFSHALTRRLTAEQLIDSQSAVLGVAAHFPGYPRGTRAAQLAGALSERRRDQGKTEADQFLASFGKPARLLPTECERSCEPTMGQAFQMMNGPLLNEMLGDKQNALGKLSGTEEEIVETLFWSALTRPPSPEEARRMALHLRESKERRAALEDVAWSLLNSKEFLFRW